MTNPFYRDIQKIDHSASPGKKAEAYNTEGGTSKGNRLSKTEEIMWVKKGLEEGKEEAFHILAHGMWMELLQENSLLREPFQTFIKNNLKTVAMPFTPFVLAIFLLPFESAVREWAVRSICQIYSSHTVMPSITEGAEFLYHIHMQSVNRKSRYENRYILKAIFVFLLLGGCITHNHYILIDKLLCNLTDNLFIIFDMYKIYLATEISLSGGVKRHSRNSIEQIKRLLRMILLNTEINLLISEQKPLENQIVILYTRWELLMASAKLDIGKELKMELLRYGLFSRNRDVIKNLLSDVIYVYNSENISIFDFYQYRLIDYLIRKKEYLSDENNSSVLKEDYIRMVRRLVLETVEVIAIYKRRIQIRPFPPKNAKNPEHITEKEQRVNDLSTDEIENMAIFLCTLWKDNMHAHPDSVVSGFIGLFFFKTEPESVIKRERNQDIFYKKLSELCTAATIRINTIDKKSLTNRDMIMFMSLHNRKLIDYSSDLVEIDTLVSLIQECREIYRHTGLIPTGIDGLCGIVGKYISQNSMKERGRGRIVDRELQSHENNSEDCDILRLFYELVRHPITDNILSQINHILVDLDNIITDVSLISLDWIKDLDLRLADRTSLKQTFLKNLLKHYLDTSNDQRILVKAVVTEFQRIQKENNLKEDETMKRLFKRAEKIVDGKKEHPTEHITKDIAVPRTQDITTWQSPPVQKVEEKLFTNKEFLLSILQDTYPPCSPVKNTYSSFSEYFEAYSSNVIKETLASIYASQEDLSEQKGPVEGIVTEMSTTANTITLTATVSPPNNLFVVNDVVKIQNQGTTDGCIGLVIHKKKEQYEILIENEKSNRKIRYYKIVITGISNIVTGAREYDALIRMQTLPIRSKIFNPLKSGAIVNHTGKGLDASHAYQKTRLKALVRESPEVDAFYSALNTSQQEAVWCALRKDITLIQGPPGTGKTRTVSCIISHLILDRRKVLVCAPSNAAVDMLIEQGTVWKNLLGAHEWIRIGAPSTRNAPDLSDQCSDKVSHRETAYSNRTDRRDTYQMELHHEDQLRILQSQKEPSYDQVKAGEKESILRCRVVFSTLSMAGSSLLKDVPFDTVVIDEACQATEPSSIIPLRPSLKNLILVGDPMQLPPTVLSQSKDLAVTLFERLSATITPLLLDTQYRMHPVISKFASDLFYNGKLKNGILLGSPLPFAFIDTKGTEEISNKDISNRAECSVVSQLIPAVQSAFTSVGIISPYKGQVRLLSRCVDRAEISTVDGFQGQEKDCIIISTVRTKRIGFLNDVRRMNVALTRAKYTVIVVGSMNLLQEDPAWRLFIEYIQENRFVYSISQVVDILKKTE